ncbi:MAG: SDR family NAD(P)-dependent oxidoreductase [Anaerolineae bacterium]
MTWRKLLFGGLAGFGIWQYARQRQYNNRVSLKNKVVLITGASSGIGRSAARIFAAQGSHLVLVARRANVLAEVQNALLAEFDVRVLTVAGDITQGDDVQQIVKAVMDQFGHLDVLVNNAGILNGGYLDDHPFDEWERILTTNLNGTIRLTHAFLPLFKAQRSGYIVNVSSVSAFIGKPGQAVYVASKLGLNGFSETLRHELFDYGVQVSVVMPTLTATPMIDSQQEAVPQDALSQLFLTVESPDYVASHIVATVRYNKKTVILGGIVLRAINWLYRLAPDVMDLIYHKILNTHDLVTGSRHT